MHVTTEELVMQQTFSNLFVFQLLSILAQSLLVWALTMCPFKWVDRKYHTALSVGITLLNVLWLLCIVLYDLYPFIRIEPLYAARGDANKCLDLLRLETLKGPIRTSYSFTYRSCTAILRLRLSDLPIAKHAAVAESQVGFLARSVAAQYFMGTSRFSSSSGNLADDLGEDSYASLHCTKSWGGIARWIAKWQLGDNIGNRTLDIAPTEATPVQKLRIEF